MGTLRASRADLVRRERTILHSELLISKRVRRVCPASLVTRRQVSLIATADLRLQVNMSVFLVQPKQFHARQARLASMKARRSVSCACRAVFRRRGLPIAVCVAPEVFPTLALRNARGAAPVHFLLAMSARCVLAVHILLQAQALARLAQFLHFLVRAAHSVTLAPLLDKCLPPAGYVLHRHHPASGTS